MNSSISSSQRLDFSGIFYRWRNPSSQSWLVLDCAKVEQQCNAVALRQMGVTVLDVFSTEVIPALSTWLEERSVVDVHYPDDSQRQVRRAMESALRPLQKAL